MKFATLDSGHYWILITNFLIECQTYYQLVVKRNKKYHVIQMITIF